MVKLEEESIHSSYKNGNKSGLVNFDFEGSIAG